MASFGQILEKTWSELSGKRPKSNNLSDSFWCYPLTLSFTYGTSATGQIQAPGNNMWCYGIDADIYHNNALKERSREACDFLTVQIKDNSTGTNFASSDIPIYSLKNLAGYNFPGFELKGNTIMDVTVAHTSVAWTSGTIKVVLVFAGYKL